MFHLFSLYNRFVKDTLTKSTTKLGINDINYKLILEKTNYDNNHYSINSGLWHKRRCSHRHPMSAIQRGLYNRSVTTVNFMRLGGR